MKWLKNIWHFVLRVLPCWLHIAAHDVEEVHQGCPDCDNAPFIDPSDYVDFTDYCRYCDLHEVCSYYDQVERKE